MRILIADDENTPRMELEEALLKAGHVVRSANSGESLAQAYTEFRPDVVVTDNRMGMTHGNEVCGVIKRTGKRTKTILTSAVRPAIVEADMFVEKNGDLTSWVRKLMDAVESICPKQIQEQS